MNILVRRFLDSIKQTAESADNNDISLEDFSKLVTPKKVLTLVKLLEESEENLEAEERNVQTMDMGMFELAMLFGDDQSNLPVDYLYTVVDRVRELLGRNTASV